MIIEASAPSNIALIKYMGKSAAQANLPANPSLSYTLEHLRTYVRIEEIEAREGGAHGWEPLSGHQPIRLSETGVKKFLDHFSALLARWEIGGTYLVRSANNFPADCGLASSASSFAALTMASYELAHLKRPDLLEDVAVLSRLSRRGSGSSCRSFFSPWSVWGRRGGGSLDVSAPSRTCGHRRRGGKKGGVFE
ncbi:MAG: hypothetical protein HC902_11365 [Calothrix sp. SM1_5_4]|nr:hypothetical protein [Calothrix sp. SM1_5_4]